MDKTKIFCEAPLIKSYEEVFSKEICDEIINWGKDKMVPGGVVSTKDASKVINTQTRDSSTAEYQGKSIPHYEHICDTISNLIGVDKSRFEALSLTHYSEGQEFKIHPDYFVHIEGNLDYTKNIEERCSKGGNRIQTVIIYLNDVDAGGETFFPWIDRAVRPKLGTVCQFNYDYDDPLLNIKTHHCGLSVLKGEKWIITIWAREKPITEIVKDFRRFKIESEYISNLRDASYSLECGPEWDRRLLKVELPRNDNRFNGIAVGATGGFESSLLLYLLAVLNSHLKVPYAIQPVMAAYEVVDGQPVYKENGRAVNQLVEFINQKNVPKVRNVVGVIPTSFDHNRNYSALKKVFLEKPQDEVRFVHWANFKYLYYGDNELPNDDDPRWLEIPFKRRPSTDPKILQPFYNLQKYHIVDAIVKLGLEEIFNIVGTCGTYHETLTEKCVYFACEERRWGFHKLGLQDLGDKYFTSKWRPQ